jgi:hypothetical protein
MNHAAVSVNSSDTEIRGTSEHCLPGAGFGQDDDLVVRKSQALCVARLFRIAFGS